MSGCIRAYRVDQGQILQKPLEVCFPFLSGRGHVVSLVGGGGKTTLMMTLAEAYASQGMKAAVMTTTRILDFGDAVQTMDDCRTRWSAGEYAVCGEKATEGKLCAPGKTMIAALLEEADALLIEADGAKRMAAKAPAEHEPVILPQSDVVIGVVGAEVLGEPIEKICFRPERVCALFGCDGSHRMTAEDIATLLLSENGTKKGVGDRAYYTVINKCDDEKRLQSGAAIARALERRGHQNVVLTKLK